MSTRERSPAKEAPSTSASRPPPAQVAGGDPSDSSTCSDSHKWSRQSFTKPSTTGSDSIGCVHGHLSNRAALTLYLQNETTRAELESLVSSGDTAELSKRFSTRIAFGTAGLRGPMQAGTSSMNDLTVLQASAGLAKYAEETTARAKERGIVVGHDHRHNSERFASLTAGLFSRRGWKVYELKGLVHTPMVPFSTSHLGAALGVMITASHNPAKDNGYKVYWENAVQIIPPHDHGIAAAIEQSLEIDEEAWTPPAATDGWDGTTELVTLYMEMVLSLSLHKSTNSSSPLRFTYTAMHGVGLPFATSAFETFGFSPSSLLVVPEQASPDPDFPTVRFPNPEEKGALDLAIAHADSRGSTVVLANDPDADRFCAAEKREDGKWVVFTGDQIGTLLGAWALERYRQSGAPIDKLAMCASTVSSKMLESMAKKEGFQFRETLTGFKWLGNEMQKLEADGFAPLFAYEEAIGFANGSTIRDKDGVTALALFCEMATELARAGKSLSAHLDALYGEYGFHATSNSYFISRDPAVTNRIFSLLRFGNPDTDSSTASPSSLKLPTSLAGYALTTIRDLTVGFDSGNPPSFEPKLPVDRSAHMISFALGSVEDGKGDGDGVEVVGTVRTSGTEPKIKFYLEARGADRAAVRAKLDKVREALGTEWLRWEENGLVKA
ncbi:phosphoglucomutase 1 [Rhodotorula diobovata]|uniref:Phosphoglucomutase 1 n=1 Tax=Rhodotorula diobovata TaxID=5288 RepID=A0A5C5G1I8_9BASI|nr:phosphoglucomutase 1 [Rhodotorula diobovata]